MTRDDDKTLITTSVRLTPADRTFLDAVAAAAAAGGMSGAAQLLITEVQAAWRTAADDFPLLPGEASLLAEVCGGTVLGTADFVPLSRDLSDAVAQDDPLPVPGLRAVDQYAEHHGLTAAGIAALTRDLDAAPRAVSWALRWLIALWWRAQAAEAGGQELLDSLAAAGLPIAAPAVSGYPLRGKGAALHPPSRAAALWLASPDLEGWDPADPGEPPLLALNAPGPQIVLPGGKTSLPPGDLERVQELAASLRWRREGGRWALRAR